MARRSILSAVRNAQPSQILEETADLSQRPTAVRPSRVAKLHIGGYFDPDNGTVMAFQKLKVDLRRSQQDMLLEAILDFVAKHEVANAFKQ